MTDQKKDTESSSAKARAGVLVGRYATPPPPNEGSSSIIEHVRPRPLGVASVSDAPAVVAVASDSLVTELSEQYRVYGAVPGLAEDLLHYAEPRFVVVEVDALAGGPWSAAVDDHGYDLGLELRNLVAGAIAVGARCLVTARDTESVPSFLDLDGCHLVAPGTAFFDGVPEGAPSTRLVGVLKGHLTAR